MKTKKYLVGAAVAAALLINIPQVSADGVETFGGEFEENDSDYVPFNEERIDSKKPNVKKNSKVKKSENEDVVIEPNAKSPEREKVSTQANNKTPSTIGKRFVKVAIDDEYTYYLDKQSVEWKRLPYSASEYMLDFWVRLVEHTPDHSNFPDYLSDYINGGGKNGEIKIARERGVSLNQADINVLKHRKFFLQHYYIRPKTKQIQFLCELEVVGHPQNTVSEREYSYKNWENLIPGSIESTIYKMTMKSVSKRGSSDRSRMSFADMMDEYLRISIR